MQARLIRCLKGMLTAGHMVSIGPDGDDRSCFYCGASPDFNEECKATCPRMEAEALLAEINRKKES